MSRVVLVVDDHPLLRKTLARELRPVFTVLQAESATQALAMLKNVDYVDAVVSDFEMGIGLTGIDLLEAVQKQSPECVRILLSGRTGGEDIARALRTGVIHQFISKPWEPGAILFGLYHAFEERKPQL